MYMCFSFPLCLCVRPEIPKTPLSSANEKVLVRAAVPVCVRSLIGHVGY